MFCIFFTGFWAAYQHLLCHSLVHSNLLSANQISNDPFVQECDATEAQYLFNCRVQNCIKSYAYLAESFTLFTLDAYLKQEKIL